MRWKGSRTTTPSAPSPRFWPDAPQWCCSGHNQRGDRLGEHDGISIGDRVRHRKDGRLGTVNSCVTTDGVPSLALVQWDFDDPRNIEEVPVEQLEVLDGET